MNSQNLAYPELTPSHLSSVLAALRFYQESEMYDEANSGLDLHSIATNSGTEVPLDAEGVDDLCNGLVDGQYLLVDARVIKGLADKVAEISSADVLMDPTPYGSGDCYQEDCARVEKAIETLDSLEQALYSMVNK